MDRVAVDSSVLIAAAMREESRLAQHLSRSDVRFLVSAYVLYESMDNLKPGVERSRLARMMHGFEQIRGTLQGIITDIELPEKDIPVMKAAVKGHASHLITLDNRDFSRYYGQTVNGVRIMHAVEYFKSIGSIPDEKK